MFTLLLPHIEQTFPSNDQSQATQSLPPMDLPHLHRAPSSSVRSEQVKGARHSRPNEPAEYLKPTYEHTIRSKRQKSVQDTDKHRVAEVILSNRAFDSSCDQKVLQRKGKRSK